METYYITDDKMQLHENLWDKNHIETPERIAAINKILQETSLLSKCKKLHSSKADIEDILLVHSQEYVESIRATTSLSEEDLEEFCSKFDDAYMNKHSWECALLSAGSALTLMKTILKHRGSNGFAAIRPPGHHASKNTACGFCIFNNIAICAKKARQMGCKRVLIVDWDVHAGQGTQYSIEDDNGIKLISIHRFEEGKFWPELPESAATQPYKNTINVPLNQLGYGDAEYASFINFLVLPIIQEWKPDLILVSCGFDAAIGDPEGEMEVSPIGFGYMTSVLASVDIPLCVLLEGGYFIESISQGARFTVQALLEKDPRKFAFDLASPSPSFLQTLFSVISLHRSDYDIFDTWIESLNAYRAENGLKQIENPPSTEYKGNRQNFTKYPTRDSYNPMTESIKDFYSKKLAQTVKNFEKHSKNKKAQIAFVISKETLEVTNGATQISIEISSYKQLLALYYYVLTPLSLTYNVSVNGKAFHPGCVVNSCSNIEIEKGKAEPKKKRKKREAKEMETKSKSTNNDYSTLLDTFSEVMKSFTDF